MRARLTWRHFEPERIALVTVAAMAIAFALVFWELVAYDDAEWARHTLLATIIHYVTTVIAWPLAVVPESAFDSFMHYWWLIWFGTGLLWGFAFECVFVALGLKWRLQES
jgi:hypothetical protein